MKQNIIDVDYQEIMFGYSLDLLYQPKTINVYIPDLMPDKISDRGVNSILNPPANIFQNPSQVSVVGSTVECNYVTLPIMNPWIFEGREIPKGQKLLLYFVNRNPKNGYVIGLG